MGTEIFYYTGTGNSLWVARRLTEQLEDAALHSIPAWQQTCPPIEAECLGLVFPVYIWGVSAPVRRFIEALPPLRAHYLFAVADNGGQVSNTLVQLKGLLAKKNLTLNAGFTITMPSNYIPWGGPGPQEAQQAHFTRAEAKIARIAEIIRHRESLPVEKGPLWQRIVFSAIYRLSYAQVPKMDGKFWVDAKCNRCGICAKVCPTANITLVDGQPRWRHHCDQCFACLQWCPPEAIQYGRKTPRYARYHHPEVQLKDVLKSKD